jgi:3-hydroxyisobutyrate dehydrogenase-like beta-hydroxyacid dehydrogenase
MKVGFIGPGQMGMPMVERMCAAGIEVTVCGRRPEVIDALQKVGAKVVPTARDAATDVDLLITCLFSDAQLEATMIDEGTLTAMKAGAVFASHVTGSPALLQRLQSMRSDVTIVDAPVSGTADQIRAGTLAVMVGCEPATLPIIQSAVGAYANPIMHVGGLGDAMKVKLVNNILFAATMQLAGAAQALGDALGIDRELLANTLANCSGASRAVALLGGRPFELMEAGTRPYLEKDVTVVAEIAEELGVTLGKLGEVAATYNKIGQARTGDEPEGH